MKPQEQQAPTVTTPNLLSPLSSNRRPGPPSTTARCPRRVVAWPWASMAVQARPNKSTAEGLPPPKVHRESVSLTMKWGTIFWWRGPDLWRGTSAHRVRINPKARGWEHSLWRKWVGLRSFNPQVHRKDLKRTKKKKPKRTIILCTISKWTALARHISQNCS